MKRLLFLIAFCLSLSMIHAQTVNVVHLKSDFDALGTITNRTENQITLQTENGRTLTIDMNELNYTKSINKIKTDVPNGIELGKKNNEKNIAKNIANLFGVCIP